MRRGAGAVGVRKGPEGEVGWGGDGRGGSACALPGCVGVSSVYACLRARCGYGGVVCLLWACNGFGGAGACTHALAGLVSGLFCL